MFRTSVLDPALSGSPTSLTLQRLCCPLWNDFPFDQSPLGNGVYRNAASVQSEPRALGLAGRCPPRGVLFVIPRALLTRPQRLCGCVILGLRYER